MQLPSPQCDRMEICAPVWSPQFCTVLRNFAQLCAVLQRTGVICRGMLIRRSATQPTNRPADLFSKIAPNYYNDITAAVLHRAHCAVAMRFLHRCLSSPRRTSHQCCFYQHYDLPWQAHISNFHSICHCTCLFEIVQIYVSSYGGPFEAHGASRKDNEEEKSGRPVETRAVVFRLLDFQTQQP